MRKWMMAGAVMILTPWIVSLCWMRAAGAAMAEEAPALESVLEDRGEAGGNEAAGEALEAAEAGAEAGEMAAEAAEAGAEAGETAAEAASEDRRIILERDGVRTYMSLEDYLPGVMVCQIDPSCHEEALKCQAVIARTYLYRLMDGRMEIYEEELDLDYLGDGNGLASGSLSGLSLQEREQAAAGLKRCRAAAQATAGIVMKQDDRYLLPLFHRVSAGRTRTGEADYPYLQSAESRWDEEAEGYWQQFSWSEGEFAVIISGMDGASPVGEADLPEQIQTVKKDDAGYMEEIKIGSKTFAGEDVQYALGLPSACFSVEGKDGRIIITTRGIGHGYGLSQAGADAQAREGWGFEEILQYYYKNIILITE